MNERPKILIVDDEPFNVDYLEQELEDLEFDTVSAGNGLEALEMVKRESPDLILLDIMMPIMDGFEVLSRIKESPVTRDIPVIIISAHSDLKSIVKGVQQGAEDYLPKPFEPILLKARIDASLTRKRFRDQEVEYLRQVELLTNAADAIENSSYDSGMIESVAARKDALGELARVFANMAEEVRAREQRLKHQILQMQMDIQEQQLEKSANVAAYIPMDRRQAMAQGISLPGSAQGTALFADVSGFTPLTESLANELGLQRGAEEILRHLNRIYTVLIDAVHRYGGSVIAFSGDAITCWFDDLDLAGRQRPGTSIERASACALAMQAGMRQFKTIMTPAGKTITLAIKVAVAAGSARRFLVGDPSLHQIDVLAGNLLSILADAEQHANRDEVVLVATGVSDLEERFIVSEWRAEKRLAVVTGLMKDVAPAPWDDLPISAIPEAQAQPWMLPAVFEKVRAGKSDLLSELRPAATLFLKFDGLEYDSDPQAGPRLDSFIRWVDQVTVKYGGSLLQLVVGDKGNYIHIVFGAPVAHNDDAIQAVLAALEFTVLPDHLHFIANLQVGLAYGQMRVGAYGGAAHRTYGAMGDKTNLAARLMQAAPAAAPGHGRILCDASIYEATLSHFEFESLHPILVKGKSRPVPVYRPVRHLGKGDSSPSNLVGRTVERALLIDRLAPAAQLTLKVASVIGQVFSLDTLSAIYPEPLEQDQLLGHLQSLSELDLIVKRSTETASYSFKDPLTHEAAYSLMLFAQRRQLHTALAELLEQSPAAVPPYAELAHHWQSADDVAKAVYYLEKAGEYAREHGEYEEASRYFNASLALNSKPVSFQ